ncbi:isochorismatase hydrolase [Myxozyma melibiosi]|uniref:Isochorismatase hydrolase n=1 Tax=Myxozyma melibiosi TaxID=54550 RepID=A0ABR1F969_9ASCO
MSESDDFIDFVRPIPPPRVIRIDAEPKPVQLDLSRTALLVVDMQNDFLHPEGWFPARGSSADPILHTIPVVEKLTALCRKNAVKVVWVNWGVRADVANLPEGVVQRGTAYGAKSPGYAEPSTTGKGNILVRDHFGSNTVDELTVAPEDLTVHKHRMSGFWDNELDSVLRKLGVTTVLLAGVNTDRCVFSTLQDASFIGYDCIMVDDACGTPSPDYVVKAVKFLTNLLYGVCTTYDNLEKAMDK